MQVKEYFTRCEGQLSRSPTELRRTCFALRRNGVETMEELCRLLGQEPKKLSELRDVGAKSLAIIAEVCDSYGSTEKG